MMTTVNFLRDRRLEQIDFEHLIEEIEGMVKDKQRDLKSPLVVLLMTFLNTNIKDKNAPQVGSAPF